MAYGTINLIAEQIIGVSQQMNITAEELIAVAERLKLIAERMGRTSEGGVLMIRSIPLLSQCRGHPSDSAIVGNCSLQSLLVT